MSVLGQKQTFAGGAKSPPSAYSGQTVARGRVYANGDNFRERVGATVRQARVGLLLVSISRTLVTYA